MDKSTKIILIAAGGIALVGGTIYLLTRKSKNSNATTPPPQIPGGTQAQPFNTFAINNGGSAAVPATQPTTATTSSNASNAAHHTGSQQSSSIQQRVETGQQAQGQSQNIINEVTSGNTPASPTLLEEAAIRAMYAQNKDMDPSVESNLLKWENAMKPRLQNLTPKFSNPRGYRNNNPGNIRHNPANNWNGMTGQDAEGFCKFSDRKYGYRAMVRILKNYELKHSNPSYKTIAEKIGRYAPQSDNNNTSGYIQHVCATTGMTPDTKIGVNNAAQLCTLVYAMAIVENGYAPLPSMAEIIEGYKMEKS